MAVNLLELLGVDCYCLDGSVTVVDLELGEGGVAQEAEHCPVPDDVGFGNCEDLADLCLVEDLCQVAVLAGLSASVKLVLQSLELCLDVEGLLSGQFPEGVKLLLEHELIPPIDHIHGVLDIINQPFELPLETHLQPILQVLQLFQLLSQILMQILHTFQ